MYTIHRIASGDRGAWVAGDELDRRDDLSSAKEAASKLGASEHLGVVIHDTDAGTYDWGDEITDSAIRAA